MKACTAKRRNPTMAKSVHKDIEIGNIRHHVNITFGMVIFRLNKVVLTDGVASILSKLPQALDLKNVAGVSTTKRARANFS
jgi:hypothetical protein